MVAPFVLLALCLLAVPASAQLQGTCTLTSSGNYFVIRVNGDSIARHDTEVTMAARVLSEHLKRPGAAVTATRVQTVRPGGCLVAPGRVDTLSIARVDTLYRRDTLTVVRVDTLRLRDTVFVPVVTPPPPPPVDTVIVTPPPPPPPPVDTVVVPPPPPPPVDTTPALTGLWSPQWKATYSRMRNENHVWWQLIAANCAGARYGDVGLWCAIVYKATGDTVAAKKGATTWLAANPQVANDNHRRENFIEGCVMYDALRPTLTAAQDSTWVGRLNAWASQSLATRAVDGDQTIGVTLGIQCLDRVAGTAWAAQVPKLTAQVQWYIDHYDGGEVDESFEYNQGTATFLMMGLAALPAGTYQRADVFLRDHARYLPFSVTGDRKQYVQWGDTQNPRDFTGRLYKTMTNWMVAQGLTRDATLQEHIAAVVAQYGARGYQSAEPWGRAFLFYDPYAPVGAVASGRHVATGRGHLYIKTPSTTVLLVASNRTYEDHEWHWAFNAEVYRNGEWALTMPRSYGEWPAYRGEASNGLSLAGLGAMAARGWTRVDSGSVAGVPWSAITGTTQGPLYTGYYDPPPSFVRYAGRTALTTEVDGWTVIVTRDTVDMDDPRTLPKFARYRNSGLWMHQTWIAAAEGLPWTVWHSNVAPTITGNRLTWQTAGGQTVAIDALTDGSLRSVVVDEKTLGGAVAASEQKFHTKLTTDAKVLWSVVRIGTGTPLAVSRTGNTVTVGSRSVTMTTASVAVVNATQPPVLEPPPAGPVDTSPPPITGPIVTVDLATRYQTMNGWEATAQAGQTSPNFLAWQSELMDSAVAIGINRMRLELASGVENPVDYYGQFRAGTITNAAYNAQRYAWVNDNADPVATNAAGFQWSKMDEAMDLVVVPLRNRLLARGDSLYLSMNYVSFGGSTAQADPNEYAELLLAAFQHLQARYGFVPDAVEAILEPDNNTIWNGAAIGRAIAAAGPRLAAAGFRPEFVAPSVMNMANAVTYLNAIVAVPGASAYLKEVGYHRYNGVTDANLVAIATRAQALGLRTAMLEHIASGVDDLLADLTKGNVSAWQQYTLAFPTSDNGAQYFTLPGNRPTTGSRTRTLAPIFTAVRRGAVRVGSTSPDYTTAAFANPDGRVVSVIRTTAAGAATIVGLPVGQYLVTFTPDSGTPTTSTTYAIGPLPVAFPGAGVTVVRGIP